MTLLMIGGILLTVGSAADQVRVSVTEYSLFSRGRKNQSAKKMARSPAHIVIVFSSRTRHHNTTTHHIINSTTGYRMIPFSCDEKEGKSFFLADCCLKRRAAMVRSTRRKAFSLHTGLLFTQQSDKYCQTKCVRLIGVVGSGRNDVLKPVGGHSVRDAIVENPLSSQTKHT